MYKYYYFYDFKDRYDRHEVHDEDCFRLPNKENRTYIGIFKNCEDAIQQAKRDYPHRKFDGCYHCSRECHNG
ncbi:hypothetical protein [Piscibacillus salipiscarius]|uniref:Uncharacterized protein n=1 Tax=Piscibacillus salipiscarius TaxID=299480 RepID=A0ABW5Q8R5_9BACI|nr:hypothetical protein [Piscibacillus salipiscarius]